MFKPLRPEGKEIVTRTTGVLGFKPVRMLTYEKCNNS